MKPPGLGEWFVRWIVPDPHAREMVTHDLRTDYERKVQKITRFGADVWYWFAVANTTMWYARERWRNKPGAKGDGMLGTLMYESRLLMRIAHRAPVFTAVTIMTIALGVGASTTVFSVLDGVVMKPLSYQNERQLVRVTHASTYSSERLGATDAHYFQYGARASTLSGFALYVESSAPADGDDGPTEVGIITATPSLFTVLGVQPLLGRLFTEEDAMPGEPDIAILSHGFWMSRFGGDSSIIGQPLSSRTPVPIVGVLPETFDFIRPPPVMTFGNAFDEPAIFIPMTVVQSQARFGNFSYNAIGRLAPGATAEEATRELTALLEPMPEAFPGGLTRQMYEEGRYQTIVEPLKEALLADVVGVLWILTGAVAFVLIIATVNVLNLFIVRAESRRDEMALRRALGANTSRIATLFLAEGFLLSLVGGIFGVVLASVGMPWLMHLAPGDVPRLDQVTLDYRVLFVAAGITVASGLVLGLVPLSRFVAMNVATVGDVRSATPTRERHGLRQTLVVAQVSFALILLIGAGLLVRTFFNLRSVDPGFGASDVLIVRVTVGGNFPTPQDKTDYLMDLTRRLSDLPGVAAATFVGDLPLDPDVYHAQFAKADAPPEPGRLPPTAARGFVGPGYFRVIGATLLEGRELARQDYETDPDGVVVNRAFADKWWPGESAIGKRTVQWPAEPDTWYQVIGVVSDIRESNLAEDAEPMVYLPTVFRPGSTYGMFVRNFALVIKTSADPLSMVDVVREEINRIASLVPITSVQTLDDLQAASMQQLSFAMVLLIIAGSSSLILGIVGIYGVVAYIVGQRTREIGVRIALGARPADIRSMVLLQSAIVGGVGVAIGLVGAVLLSGALQSMLFGVAGTDLVTYGGFAIGLFGLVITASLFPAKRAAAVDPMTALRTD